MYSTRQMVRRNVFACKLNLDQLFLSLLFKLRIPGNIKFQRTKSDVPILKDFFIKVYLSIPPNYFRQSNQFYWSICTIFMLS